MGRSGRTVQRPSARKSERGLEKIIAEARETNPQFTAAFNDFYEKCCQALNPNLAEDAVEEMLIQHLLTVRLFRTVFNNPDFVPPKCHRPRN